MENTMNTYPVYCVESRATTFVRALKKLIAGIFETKDNTLYDLPSAMEARLYL